MCKNLDGENLVNFWSIVNFVKFLWHKISLHTVLSIWITVVRIHCIVAYDFAVIMIVMVICSQVNFIFDNNTVTNQNGQGQAFYADDISVCLLDNTVDTADQLFKASIFSDGSVFDFRQVAQ